MSSFDFNQDYVTDLKYFDIQITDAPGFRYGIPQVQIITAGHNGFTGRSSEGKILTVTRLVDENGNKFLEIMVCADGEREELFYVIKDQPMAGKTFSTTLEWMRERLEKEIQ